MNKLQKGKLNEIENQLYNINTLISLQYIGLKRIPTHEDMIILTDAIAVCIRQLRTLQQ